MLLTGVLLLFTLDRLRVSAIDSPIVDTKYGSLKGTFMTSRNGRKFSAFLGIPYAKPPIGDLRFKPPVNFEPWNDIKSAVTVSGLCPQLMTYVKPPILDGNEDCLHLNIYTPNTSGSSLPVIFYIHGGAFYAGGASPHQPDYLLDKDVILVTINYRLGALGFLSTDDNVVTGNNGLKDQAMALKWVYDNIENFGGDPKKITVMGNSAGGASTQFLMVSPLTKSLISGVIALSGDVTAFWSMSPKGENLAYAKKLSEHLKCPTDDNNQMIECLKGVDALEVAKGEEVLVTWDLDPITRFKPVIEPNHDGAFLTEHPLDIISNGRAANVPQIISTVEHDGALRSLGILHDPELLKELNANFEKIIPQSLLYYELDDVLKSNVTKWIKDFYFNGKPISSTDIEALTNVYSDSYFYYPSTEAIQYHRMYMKTPVYSFQSSHRNVQSFGMIFGYPENDFGVVHCDDLLSIFPIKIIDKPETKDDRRVSEILLTLVTNFVRTGNPTPDPVNSDLGKWEPVTSEDLEYYVIDAKPTGMIKGFYKERMQLWKSIFQVLRENVKFS